MHFNRMQVLFACAIGILAPTSNVMLYAGTGNGQPQGSVDPAITTWYGKVLPFGGLGNPVPAVDILGNVTPSKGLSSLTYTLNGGEQETLTVGPDNRRLERAGDFNIDIPYRDLIAGANQVIIIATGASGAVRETVMVNYMAGQIWPLPYSINWSSVGRIDDAAQILDGRWSIQSGNVRPVELGYDRMIAIGDEQWSDYEITVPVTILGIDSSGFDPPSNGCLVGFLMRWPGNSDLPIDVAGRQPKTGYLPFGALGANNWSATGQRLRILGNNLRMVDQDSTGRTLLFNTPYIFKMKVETIPGNGGRYMMKVWEAADPEPVEWDLVGQEDPTDPQRGSVTLIAHHVDALFGNVSIVPVKTTIPSSIVSDDFNTPTINTSLWTLVNPLADASFTLSGTNTPNAWVNIGIPGGTAHDPWTSGNNAPRLIQPANNTDFEVEAKFESGISQRYQLQGIIAEENQNSFIRFEFHSDGTSTRMFVASLVNNVPTTRLNAVLGPNGTAPLYMRVKRVGDGWLMRYSLDGSSWTTATSFNHVMNLTGIGPYGANSGTPPPAFMASIDYFFNTNSPIIPEDSTHLTAPAITQQPVSDTVNVGQTATFTVVASGSAPLSYQWQKKGVDIGGATSASYTTPPAVSGDNGASFRCVVSNAAGSATSGPAILTVLIPPAITQQPVSDTVNVGQTATFTVVASGSAPLSYQWKKNGVNIGGATSASYTTPPAVSGDNGATYHCVVSNAGGSATSALAILTVIIPPAITQQPVSDTVNVGQTATFSVVASGTAPLSYQWQKNGVNIGGATSASYTTPAATLGDNGATFRCTVSNAAGSAVSAQALLTVTVAIIPPTITQQPVSDTVNVSQTATFTVVASGSAPLSYQWKKNGSNINGATSASYTTPPAVSGDNGASFRCVVSNAAGSATSGPAILTVLIPPAITQQPVNDTVNVGQTATFTVAASGSTPLSHQWKKNGSNISGATSPSYTTPPAVSGDNGATFRCVVSNAAGSATSGPAILTVLIPPAITQQPMNDTVNVGQTATFTVVASGSAPLSYQWKKNGSNIGGATSASYTTPPAVSGDNGATFRCVVSNAAGSATSTQAILTVINIISLPEITQQPLNDTVSVGETATFAVVAGGSGPLSYQWKKNGSNISGATSASYTTPPATLGDNGATFRCRISNSVGSATSASAILTVVNDPPEITQQPVNDTVNIGQTATFTVVASGSAPLSYQWKKNGANIGGATSASYTTPPATLNDNGDTFRCRVSNSAGSVTSTSAILTVINDPPEITEQPVNDTVNVGQTATFTVVASGSGPLSYQWKKNGSNISGATSASYTTPPATLWDNGATFRCRVSNSAGSATSTSAILTVINIIAPPAITQQPANDTVSVGQTATFTVVATGTPLLLYQWQKNGVNIGGAIFASYTTPPVTNGDDGAHFRCRVSNMVGSITSNEATLHVMGGGNRVTAGLLSLYTFHEGCGNDVGDVSGVLPRLDLEIANPSRVRWHAGYLTIEEKTVIRSDGPATKIIAGAMETNELSIEAWVRPLPECESGDDDSPAIGNTDMYDGENNNGLARIVSNASSETMKRRNFSLESFNDNYIGRLKTTVTDNEVRPNATSPDDVVEDELTHLLYTRSEAGVAKLFINGEQVTTANVGGNLSNWSMTYPLSIANEISLNRPWYGDIHLVALYDRALSPNEVQQNFTAGPDPELGVAGAITATYGGPAGERDIPDKYILYQNYPNPFNPETRFDFSLLEGGKVSLVIYDLLGQEVMDLVDGALEAGNHSVRWNGESSASGVYVARFQVIGTNGELVYARSNKLILLR